MLRHAGVVDGPVPESLVTEHPRIHVSRIVGLMSSGATQWSQGRWLVLIKSTEPATRQRFSIAHEFKHILDNRFYDLMYGAIREADRAEFIEQVCDYFAGSLLVPRAWLKRQWCSGMQDTRALAKHFHVSTAAIEVRLQQTGLAGPTTRCLQPRVIANTLRPETTADTSARYERQAAPLLST
jgi:Zn-dependent peptidase ImmA (M78 family)